MAKFVVLTDLKGEKNHEEITELALVNGIFASKKKAEQWLRKQGFKNYHGKWKKLGVSHLYHTAYILLFMTLEDLKRSTFTF